MVSQKITLTNEQGLHMRPAGIFAAAMGKFRCEVKIRFNNSVINGKSVMNIMIACIKKGSEIEIVCNGEDENEALAEAMALIESGFDE